MGLSSMPSQQYAHPLPVQLYPHPMPAMQPVYHPVAMPMQMPPVMQTYGYPSPPMMQPVFSQPVMMPQPVMVTQPTPVQETASPSVREMRDIRETLDGLHAELAELSRRRRSA